MLLELFAFFFKIGLFSFGGGYAMIPLLHQELVEKMGWMTESELIDMVAISQMTPGPIAVNLASYLGFDKAGILGSFFATLGVVMPSFVIMTIFWLLMKRLADNLYFNYLMTGLRPLVIGLILAGIIAVIPSSLVDLKTLAIGLGAFYLIHVKDISAILVILIGAGLGLVLY